MVSPIGLDKDQPRFSWKLKDERYGATQRAYQVIVSKNSITGSEKIWDSGLRNGTDNIVRYEGPALQSFKQYSWTLKLWDMNMSPVEPAIGKFETGFMRQSEWEGKWITDDKNADYRPATLFRKEFVADKEIVKARLYIASAGLHEASINGKNATTEFLNPIFTRYDKRILYNTYDVTETLNQGKNVIGLILGNGWYNHQIETVVTLNNAVWRGRPSFIANLKLTYDDGEEETIYSDESWRINESPILFNSIYASETYDFRKEIPDWNKPAYDDDQWNNAQPISSPTNFIEAQILQPISRTETLRPLEVKKLNNGRYLFKFPKNIAGITELSASGEKDTKIRIIHSEITTPHDEADNHHFAHVYPNPKEGEVFHEDVIYLNGGPFKFSPKFNYKGFQFVEVISDKPIELTEESIVAYRINTDLEESGLVRTSNTLVNNIWSTANSSYLSNMVGYPTDCPQREKNGWTGDGHLMAESGLFNYNPNLVYEKWLKDHRDAQESDGRLPLIIPTSHWGYHFDALDWTSSMIIIPWEVYFMTGDITILQDNYQSMKLFHQFWSNRTDNYLMDHNGFADWQTSNSSSSPRLIASAFYYRCTDLLSKISLQLADFKGFIFYNELAGKIKSEFNKAYYRPEEGIYENGTQTELALSIAFGLTTESNLNTIAESLEKKIELNKGFLDVGVIGNRVLLDALAQVDLEEEAFNILTETNFPSWGNWIEQGLTSFAEAWNYEGWIFGGSLNHAFFGTVSSWMYKSIGGINPNSYATGFKKIELKPKFDRSLGEVEVWHESPLGKIIATIEPTGEDDINYSITIPPGSSAEFHIPNNYTIVDFDKSSLPPEYIPKRTDSNSVTFQSGSYSFRLSKGGIAYPFTEIINSDLDKYGNLTLEEGQVFFSQGNINGIAAEVQLITVDGRVTNSYDINGLFNNRPLFSIPDQLGPLEFKILRVKVYYEDGTQKFHSRNFLRSND